MQVLLRKAISRALWAIALSVASITFADAQVLPERCWKAAERAESGLPLPYDPTASEELVYLRIAGVRYAIPENYFRDPPIGCDTEERALLLRVLLPNFEGWSLEKDEQFVGSPGEPRMWMNILLVSVPRPNMDGRFQAFARGADPGGDHPVWDGLLHTKNRHGDDVYFTRERGRVTFLMVCSTMQRFPFPSCQQHSIYRGAPVQATFGREHLASWRDIRQGTEDLLDAFVRNASSKPGEE